MNTNTNAIRVTTTEQLKEATQERLAVVFPNSAFSRGAADAMFNVASKSLENVTCLVERTGNVVSIQMTDSVGNNLATTTVQSITVKDDVATRGDRIEVATLVEALDRFKAEMINANLDHEEMHDYFVSVEQVREMFLDDPEQENFEILEVTQATNNQTVSLVYGLSTVMLAAKKDKVDTLCGKDMSVRMSLSMAVPVLQAA